MHRTILPIAGRDRKTLVGALLVIFVLLSCHTASSQTRTIKIVAPAPPGGVLDAVARLLGDQISRAHALTVLVENRTGAGGGIAAEAVSRAAPDGNTLLIMTPDALIPPHLRKVNYSMLTGFEPICELVNAPTVLVVNMASPYRTLTDLVDAARAKPSQLTLASYGPATAQQIAFETLKRAADVNMTFLPYSGAAPVINALLGDHVTSGLATYSTASEQLNAGKLRSLATLSRTRIEPLPEVPTVAEYGYKDVELDYWLGILAPAKTPEQKLSQLAGWFRVALQVPELKAKLTPLGLYSVGSCGADFATVLRKQNDEFGRVIREANIKAE
jgi:tripartite-type tricarboxylate transporter receptor subunit TctC